MANKITTLYEDSAKTTAIYPRTKASAVSDNDGNALGEVAVYHAQDLAGGVKGVDLHLDMDLLWTNAAPTSAFAAQTISLDLSNYTMILVKGKYTAYTNSSDNGFGFGFILVGETGSFLVPPNQGTTGMKYRITTVTTTGVTFGAGGSDDDSNPNNLRCIPIEIYGIK